VATVNSPTDVATKVPNDSAVDSPPPPAESPKTTTPAQIVLLILGVIAFLYFARPVLLPVFMAVIAGMVLRPVTRLLAQYWIPPGVSAALLLLISVGAFGIGFFQLGRPALAWISDAPQHVAELRQRVQLLFPRIKRFSEAAAAVNNLGATAVDKPDEELPKQTVEIKETRGTTSILNWTGTFLAGIGETMVLLYLILASGDLFLQKLVHVLPTLRDKKRAVEISHEIQQNISHYLLSVSVINLGLGAVVSGGLFWLGVPNPMMWGLLAALVNFVPYFGPIVGVILLGMVGLLTFDTLLKGLLPAGWYLVIHLLEANLITPVLLGKRFTLNPVVIFVSLIFWTWLWGVPGALMSVPILVSLRVICDRFPALSSVSEILTS